MKRTYGVVHGLAACQDCPWRTEALGAYGKTMTCLSCGHGVTVGGERGAA